MPSESFHLVKRNSNFKDRLMMAVVFAVVGLLVWGIVIPAIHTKEIPRALRVAVWQRHAAIYTDLTIEQMGAPPLSYALFFADPEFRDEPFENPKWNFKNSDIRVGAISLQDIIDGSATYESLKAEIDSLDLPIPRWETFGPIAFLIHEKIGDLPRDAPISIAVPDKRRRSVNIGFADTSVITYNLDHREDDYELAMSQIAANNLPPLPTSFLSRLPH